MGKRDGELGFEQGRDLGKEGSSLTCWQKIRWPGVYSVFVFY